MLITVINSVLEKNLSPQLVVNFRSVFHRRRMRFAQVVAAALPNTPEGIFPLTLPMFAEVAGLWPLGPPSREKEQMLEQPEFVHLKVDFRKEMTPFLHILFASAVR
jgi:Tetracyclin repressor-like, C-terminal domain